jgi:DeoR/GlpR family transcriptional regulator of sugar metabolism
MKTPSKRNTASRRGWFRDQLEKNGQLSYNEIRKQYPAITRKTISHDIEALKESGLAIIAARDEMDGTGIIILETKPRPLTVIHRQNSEKDKKEAIGNVGCGLIWGTLDNSKVLEEELKNVLNQHQIFNQLDLITRSKFILASQKAAEVRCILDGYWKKSHRSVATDSGTTISSITKKLAMIRIPDPHSILSALDIFTNSSMIVDDLRKPCVTVGVVVIGGRLRKDTDACTGELTRQCLASWHLQLDIAVVGTTNINKTTQEFACDSENEAVTKGLIHSLSSLRCIAADSSKFRANAPSSAYAFCPISGKSIDLFITDDAVDQASVEMLLNRGVAVITPSGNHLKHIHK